VSSDFATVVEARHRTRAEICALAAHLARTYEAS
jgi:hypothetical protein